MTDSRRTPADLRRMAQQAREIARGVDDVSARMLQRFARSYEAEAEAEASSSSEHSALRPRPSTINGQRT